MLVSIVQNKNIPDTWLRVAKPDLIYKKTTHMSKKCQ